MKNTLETRLGIFFALAFIAAIIIIEMLGGPEFFKRGYRLKARFNNVQELKVGDTVKMAGVQIGRVDDIDFGDGKVTVTMKINNRKAAIKTDSQATIKFLGLLGQNYIAISFGTATAPRAETELSTLEQPDLNSLMTKLDHVAAGVEHMTANMGGDNFSNLLGPFNDFFKESKTNLSATITNIQRISAQIAEGKGTVGKLVMEDSLYNSALTAVTNVNDTVSFIQGAANEAKNLIAGVREGQGTLGRLAKEDALYRETTNAVTQLREIFEKINHGQGTAGKLVNDEALLKNVKMTLQKLDKATEGLEDQGPLSVLSIFSSKLF